MIVLYNLRMELEKFKKTADDDCVEAEIVSGPGIGGASDPADGRPTGPSYHRAKNYGAPDPEPSNIPFYGLFVKLKYLVIIATVLLSFGLIVVGLILTSTVIGAIIGVPLLLIGGFLIWLLFKLLGKGQKNQPFIFHRF